MVNSLQIFSSFCGVVVFFVLSTLLTSNMCRWYISTTSNKISWIVWTVTTTESWSTQISLSSLTWYCKTFRQKFDDCSEHCHNFWTHTSQVRINDSFIHFLSLQSRMQFISYFKILFVCYKWSFWFDFSCNLF